MKFEYDGVEYPLVDPDQWTTLDAIQVERASGRKPAELIVDFQDAGPLGLHALAWVSLRRSGLDVAWDELRLPWLDTVQSLNGSAVEAVDPSTASTQARRAPGGRNGSRARSVKK